MNTENNMNPMSLDDLFAASPAPVAPESTPLPEIAQTAPAETTVPEPTPSAEQQTTPFAAEQPAASQPDNIIDRIIPTMPTNCPHPLRHCRSVMCGVQTVPRRDAIVSSCSVISIF